jgi:hypothetical protein
MVNEHGTSGNGKIANKPLAGLMNTIAYAEEKNPGIDAPGPCKHSIASRARRHGLVQRILPRDFSASHGGIP